ncbi:hypothetical protein LOK49_LG02G00721 [Camellia lanceoleosa]|uniref:Uncharacterized protein n=1 Tax=Camellia lanceoleosa TaxID=1840588 RepID=A0ACC0IN99_9ERIC|nr:hypothetical protein LOK49_LG02G00721 [Camellia lanceoleosa]
MSREGNEATNGETSGDVRHACRSTDRDTPNHPEIVVDASPVSCILAMLEQTECNGIDDVVERVAGDVVVVSPLLANRRKGDDWPNSFVNSEGCSVPANRVDGVGKHAIDVKMIDVDAVRGSDNKFSGLGINNRHTIRKMMMQQKKDIISSAYERYGDGTTMWVRRVDGNAVYFSDVRAIVRQAVIDTYVEMLADEQTRLNVEKEFPETSYFFSSICLDMMKNENLSARYNYVTSNLVATKGARYIHFPICHLSHWTLVVYDMDASRLKHFNSMHNRNGPVGVHYAEALYLKNIVSEMQRQMLDAYGRDDVVEMQDFEILLELVVECPQQRPDSLDCAIIVCAVMR